MAGQFIPRTYRKADVLASGFPMNGRDTLRGMGKRVSDSERTDFGLRLKQAREAAGLSQVDAAKAIGVAQGTIGELEKIGLGSAYTTQFAALYRVSPQWLADGKGSRRAVSGLSDEVSAIAMKLDALEEHERERVLVIVRQLLDIASSTVNGTNKHTDNHRQKNG